MNCLRFARRVPAGCRAAFLTLAILVIAPTLAGGQTRPDFTGVWSTTFTIPQDAAWRIEDYGCFLGCPVAVYQRLRELVKDPANNERPFELLLVEAWQLAATRLAAILTPEGLALRDQIGLDDAQVIRCEPLGFARQVTAPLPLRIDQRDDGVILSYEEWSVVRTIHMDGRGHPSDMPPSRHGHSIGRYEGSTLVIETAGLKADSLWPEHGGGGYTDRLRTVERYTRDNGWLKLEFTLDDPKVLREPLVYEKVWRFTPGVEFLKHSCETIAGQP